MTRKRVMTLLRIVASAGLLAWVFFGLVPWEDLREIRVVSWWPLLAFVLVVNLDRLIIALGWIPLLRAKGIEVPAIRIIGSYYVTTMLGSVMLPTVGADAVRAIDIGRESGRPIDVASSIVVERLLGLLAIGVNCLLAVALLPLVAPDWEIGWFLAIVSAVVLAVILGVGGLALSMRADAARFVPARLRESNNKIVKVIRKFASSYQEYRDHKGALALCLASRVFKQVAQLFCSFLVSEALGLDIHIVYFFVFFPIIQFISNLPISFDGYGVREGLFAGLFTFAAVPEGHSVVLGLVGHLGRKVAIIPPVLFFLWSMRFSTRELRGAAAARGTEEAPGK